MRYILLGFLLLLMSGCVSDPKSNIYFFRDANGSDSNSFDGNFGLIDLNDGQTTYSGSANKFLQVNPTETGWIFSTVTPSGTDTNCSTSVDCNTLFVNASGDTMTGPLAVQADVNISIGNLNIVAGDKNAINIKNNAGINVFTVDQNGNVRIDGNVTFNGAGSTLGTAGDLPFRILSAAFRAIPGNGLGSLLIPVNTFAFCVFQAASPFCSGNGLYFNSMGTSAFQFKIADVNSYELFAGANSLNSWLFGTRTNPPTDSDSKEGGVMYVDDDRNRLYINQGNPITVNWVPVGEDLNKLHVDLNADIDGSLNVDQNIFGEVFGIQVAVGTSCNTGCTAFNNTPAGSTWVCLNATTLAAVASTCGDTLVPKNCQCQN